MSSIDESAAVSADNKTPRETSDVASQDGKKTWLSYVWDTLDKSPEERRFLFKLDAVILTFASFG